METSHLYKELYSEVLNPDHFHAAAAEAFGAADRNLRKAYASGDSDATHDAVNRLFMVGRAFLDALEQQGLSRDYTATLIMLIISADMAGVSPSDSAADLLYFHSKLMRQCGRLTKFFADDDFAKPHIAAITYMECAIYVFLVDNYLDSSIAPVEALKYKGIAEAARDRLSERAPEGCIPVEPFNLKNLLIDIFSRLNTLGFF